MRELLTSVFGDDGSAEEDDAGVTIRVTALADHRAELGAIQLAGREIARAFGPASRVRIGTGVRFLVGAASPEGAAGAWSTMVPAGSVLEIRNVPLAQAALLTGAHEDGRSRPWRRRTGSAPRCWRNRTPCSAAWLI